MAKKISRPAFTTPRGRLYYAYLTGEPNEYKKNKNWMTQLRFEEGDDHINMAAVEDWYAKMRQVENELVEEYKRANPKEKILGIVSGLRDVETDNNDNDLPLLLKTKTGVFDEQANRGRPNFFDRKPGPDGKARIMPLEEAKDYFYSGAYAIIKGVITAYLQDSGVLYLTYRPRGVQFVAHGPALEGAVDMDALEDDGEGDNGNAPFDV